MPSIVDIINVLEEMIEIHEQLLEISKRKTKLLMDHSTEELSKLLILENQCVQSLEHSEEKRQQLIDHYFLTKDIEPHEKTITNLINFASNPSKKDRLREILIELTDKITNLKQQEHLNTELIQQSIHFNQMMLDVTEPSSIEKDIHYGKDDSSSLMQQSIFDSEI